MVILVQALFDNCSQNPKIMNTLTEEWKKSGHKVIRFYPCYSRKRVRELNRQGDIFSFYFPQRKKYKKYLNLLDSCNNSLTNICICCFRHPFSTIEFIVRRIPYASNLFDESYLIKRKTEKAIKLYNANIVVAGSNPFYFPLGLVRANIKCKRIWYQMDPHALNGMMTIRCANREIIKERLVYERMDKIFVQPNSYESIVSNFSAEIVAKIFETKFPLVTPDKVVNPDISYFNKNTINCVYAGALMLPIRRPEYMLKLFSYLANKSVHLYIWCGNLTKSMQDELEALLPGNVSYCGSLPQFEMQSVLAGADFLVSLGNSITNQLPSKVLDYISLRKPIINITKVDGCPTLELLKDYPIAINVSEDENVELASVKLEKFINDNIGKTATIEDLKKYYREYLPSTVASKLLDS